MKIIIALAMLLLSAPAFACQFDTDCNPGSKCLKAGYSIYGYCTGGIAPGNSNDRQPVRNTMDLTGKQGNTCQFNIDCGVGGKCLKSGGIYGTCY